MSDFVADPCWHSAWYGGGGGAVDIIRIRYRGSRELGARSRALRAAFRAVRREVWREREATLRTVLAARIWEGYA